MVNFHTRIGEMYRKRVRNQICKLICHKALPSLYPCCRPIIPTLLVRFALLAFGSEAAHLARVAVFMHITMERSRLRQDQ